MTIAKKLGKKKSHKAIVLLFAVQFFLIFLYVKPDQAYDIGLIVSSTGLGLLICNHYYSKRVSVPPGFYLTADLTLILPGILITLLS